MGRGRALLGLIIPIERALSRRGAVFSSGEGFTLRQPGTTNHRATRVATAVDVQSPCLRWMITALLRGPLSRSAVGCRVTLVYGAGWRHPSSWFRVHVVARVFTSGSKLGPLPTHLQPSCGNKSHELFRTSQPWHAEGSRGRGPMLTVSKIYVTLAAVVCANAGCATVEPPNRQEQTGTRHPRTVQKQRRAAKYTASPRKRVRLGSALNVRTGSRVVSPRRRIPVYLLKDPMKSWEHLPGRIIAAIHWARSDVYEKLLPPRRLGKSCLRTFATLIQGTSSAAKRIKKSFSRCNKLIPWDRIRLRKTTGGHLVRMVCNGRVEVYSTVRFEFHSPGYTHVLAFDPITISRSLRVRSVPRCSRTKRGNVVKP